MLKDFTHDCRENVNRDMPLPFDITVIWVFRVELRDYIEHSHVGVDVHAMLALKTHFDSKNVYWGELSLFRNVSNPVPLLHLHSPPSTLVHMFGLRIDQKWSCTDLNFSLSAVVQLFFVFCPLKNRANSFENRFRRRRK